MQLDQYKSTGFRLRGLREDKELKQVNIAHLLNTSQTVYSRYERDERALPLHHLKTLCQFYDVSADYLLGLIDEAVSYKEKG